MNTKDNYTNLTGTYIYKFVVFIAVAILTFSQSKTFETLLVAAISYLVGILFDLFILAKTNNGPKLKMRNYLSYFLHYLLFLIILVMVILLIGYTITDVKVQETITLVIYILVGVYTVMGFILEIVSNRPMNN